jgi:hypothetical protein
MTRDTSDEPFDVFVSTARPDEEDALKGMPEQFASIPRLASRTRESFKVVV